MDSIHIDGDIEHSLLPTHAVFANENLFAICVEVPICTATHDTYRVVGKSCIVPPLNAHLT